MLTLIIGPREDDPLTTRAARRAYRRQNGASNETPIRVVRDDHNNGMTSVATYGPSTFRFPTLSEGR